MEYGAPTNVLIVGDGNYIVYNDTDLDQVTHIDYDDIPATLILANDIKIDGKKSKSATFIRIPAAPALRWIMPTRETWGRLRWFSPMTRWN